MSSGTRPTDPIAMVFNDPRFTPALLNTYIAPVSFGHLSPSTTLAGNSGPCLDLAIAGGPRRLVHMEPRICPHCKGKGIRPSRPRFIDAFFYLFGMWPFRCVACNTRFYASKDPKPGENEPPEADGLAPAA
jgi:hypothetical protein